MVNKQWQEYGHIPPAQKTQWPLRKIKQLWELGNEFWMGVKTMLASPGTNLSSAVAALRRKLREEYLSPTVLVHSLPSSSNVQYTVPRLPLWYLFIYINYIKLLSYNQSLSGFSQPTQQVPADSGCDLSTWVPYLFLVTSCALQPHWHLFCPSTNEVLSHLRVIALAVPSTRRSITGLKQKASSHRGWLTVTANSLGGFCQYL